MEGEVVSVEPAVVQTPLPAEPHIILNEERRHKTPIGQVRDGHRKNYWKYQDKSIKLFSRLAHFC